MGTAPSLLPFITRETGYQIKKLEQRLDKEVEQGKLMINLAETQLLMHTRQGGNTFPDVQGVR